MCQQAEPMAKAGQTLMGRSTPPSQRLVGTRCCIKNKQMYAAGGGGGGGAG